jgi:type I restriction enzyme, S subunit
LDESGIYQITPELSSEFKRSVLQGNEVLLSIQGTIGRVAICPPHLRGANISRTIALIAPDERINRDFLRYWLLSIDGEFPICGSTRASLNIGALRELKAPVPSPGDQQRIVGILDEAFDGIATAKANAEKNLQNASAIFESHLQSVFTQRGDGWVEKRLEQIGTTQTGSTPKTDDKANYGNFIPFIKPADFKKDGSLDYEHDGLSEQGLEQARIVAKGSVLMVCIGATIGKSGYCDCSVTTNQQINALTPADGVSHKFVYYQMLTESFQRRVVLNSSQATLPIINKSKWSTLKVWLPPKLAEQKRIAAQFDGLAAETQRLAHLYERKLAALEALKKSLLHQAFNGNL